MVYGSWFTCDLGIQMMSVKGAAVVVMVRKLSSKIVSCIVFGLWMPPSESNSESDYKTITCSS